MSITTGVLTPAADLDALFRRYHSELAASAYRRLKDRDAAADIVQDAFLRYLSSGAPDSAVQPRFFLRRIVNNLAIDVLRARQRRLGDVPAETMADTLADPYPTADRWVAARQDYAILKRVLDRLPSTTRAALLLSRVEGLTHPEIAKRMGISTSMVVRHIMNAVAHCLVAFPPSNR